MKVSLRVKVIGMVVFASLLLSFAGIYISYKSYTDTIKEHYMDLTSDIANATANTVDKALVEKVKDEVMERYLSTEGKVSTSETDTPEFDAYVANFEDIAKSEDYVELCHELSNIQRAHDCQSVYFMYPYEPDEVCVFIADASPTDPSMPGSFDNVYGEQSSIFSKPEEGYAPFITDYPEYGWLCSAAVPVYGENGDIIAEAFVDISMEAVMADCDSYLRWIVITLGAITIVLMIIYIIIVETKMVRPINLVAKSAIDYMADEDDKETADHFLELKINTNDEIENLADALKEMEKDIHRYIENLTKVTSEKERIGAELSLATEIQASYLPNIFPPFPDHKEFDLYAMMHPAKEVGGDFYDFFLIDEDHLGLVMADVSGKGVPAALFMMISKTLLKNQAHFDTEPGKILENVNKQLCENNEAEMFVTVWLGILELSTGRLRTANAGHEYPAICRANGEFELYKDKHGMPLGTMSGLKYKEEELKLSKGDILFVYTDGVAEATNAGFELYGTDRMIEVLNNHKNDICDDIIRGVKADIDGFVGDAPQFDDITMLALKIN